MADEVGDAGAVLAGSEAGELDFRGAEPGLGGRGVKSVVNVGGDVLGVLADAGVGVLLRHGANDFSGQSLQGAFAGKGLIKFARNAFALGSVAVGTLGSVNGCARMVCCIGLKSAQAQECGGDENKWKTGAHKW